MNLATINKKLSDATAALAKAEMDLKLEIAGAAADAAGIIDPTPTSDLIAAGISVARGDYAGAALSVASTLPYLGDALAKPVKASRFAKKAIVLEKKIATLTKTVNDLKKAKHEAETVESGTRRNKATPDKVISTPMPKRGVIRRDKDCEKCSIDNEKNKNSSRVATKIKNGYTYSLDEKGRVISVKGKLVSDPTQKRSSKEQLDAGGKDRLSTDDGGHFVARRFKGPLERMNHFAQNKNFNRSAYKKLENRWQSALDSGKEVLVDIKPEYIGDSLRPHKLIVKYKIDGKPFLVDFMNRHGGK